MACVAAEDAVVLKNGTGDPAQLCFSATSEGWKPLLHEQAVSTTGFACRVQWGSALKVASSLRWGLPLTEAGRSEGVSRDGRGANKGIHTARCVQRGLKVKTERGLLRCKQGAQGDNQSLSHRQQYTDSRSAGEGD